MNWYIIDYTSRITKRTRRYLPNTYYNWRIGNYWSLFRNIMISGSFYHYNFLYMAAELIWCNRFDYTEVWLSPSIILVYIVTFTDKYGNSFRLTHNGPSNPYLVLYLNKFRLHYRRFGNIVQTDMDPLFESRDCINTQFDTGKQSPARMHVTMDTV